jgi:hypothetical protein
LLANKDAVVSMALDGDEVKAKVNAAVIEKFNNSAILELEVKNVKDSWNSTDAHHKNIMPEIKEKIHTKQEDLNEAAQVYLSKFFSNAAANVYDSLKSKVNVTAPVSEFIKAHNSSMQGLLNNTDFQNAVGNFSAALNSTSTMTLAKEFSKLDMVKAVFGDLTNLAKSFMPFATEQHEAHLNHFKSHVFPENDILNNTEKVNITALLNNNTYDTEITNLDIFGKEILAKPANEALPELFAKCKAKKDKGTNHEAVKFVCEAAEVADYAINALTGKHVYLQDGACSGTDYGSANKYAFMTGVNCNETANGELSVKAALEVHDEL